MKGKGRGIHKNQRKNNIVNENNVTAYIDLDLQGIKMALKVGNVCYYIVVDHMQWS